MLTLHLGQYPINLAVLGYVQLDWLNLRALEINQCRGMFLATNPSQHVKPLLRKQACNCLANTRRTTGNENGTKHLSVEG